MIFVKSRKTASTSVEIALSFLARHDEQAVVTPIDQNSENFRRAYGIVPRNIVGITNPIKDYYFSGSLIGMRRIAGDFKHKRKYWNHMPLALIRARLGQDVFDKSKKISIDRNKDDMMLSHINWKAHQDKRISELEDYFKFFCPPDNNELFEVNGRYALDEIFHQEKIQILFEYLENIFQEEIPIEIRNYKSKAVVKKFSKQDLEEYQKNG